MNGVITQRSYPIEADVTAVMERAQCTGSKLVISEQLDRTMYVKVNKVLEAIGGKWDRKAKGHIFEGDAADVVDQALLTGAYTKVKQDFGAFYTPDDVAEVAAMHALCGAHPGDRWLEPSAGEGALLKKLKGQDYLTVDAVEIQPASCAKLGALGMLNMHITCGDFLAMDVGELGVFDRIIMNPPFAKRQDVFHIFRAWSLLKAGGRLVAIASASVIFRQDAQTAELRQMIESYGHTEEFDAGAFKESGTMVRTVLIVLDKPK